MVSATCTRSLTRSGNLFFAPLLPCQIEPDAAGKAQQKVVGEFKARLARIIEKNETLPELEKMDRSEFVVDVAGRC